MVFVNNPTQLCSEENMKRGGKGVRMLQGASRATKRGHNPFGRRNTGRWWPDGRAFQPGDLLVLTSEGQHCPHVFQIITFKLSQYRYIKFMFKLNYKI